jgi:hypothetical protein
MVSIKIINVMWENIPDLTKSRKPLRWLRQAGALFLGLCFTFPCINVARGAIEHKTCNVSRGFLCAFPMSNYSHVNKIARQILIREIAINPQCLPVNFHFFSLTFRQDNTTIRRIESVGLPRPNTVIYAVLVFARSRLMWQNSRNPPIETQFFNYTRYSTDIYYL